MIKPNCSFICVSALLFLGSGAALAFEPQFFDRTLPVSGPVVLDISTSPGGIRIIKGSEDAVRIHAIIRPLYGLLDLGVAEESIRALQRNPPIERTGNHIRIGYSQLDRLRAVSMTVEVETPGATQVHAQTTSGGIDIQGPLGPVVATTASGHTEISDVAEPVRAASHSGGIIIRGTQNQAFVRTDSGGVQVFSATGGLDLESHSGRIEVRDASGDVRATAHSGSISIDKVTGSITAKNTSGGIHAFQVAGAVRAETISGAIHIAQIRPAPIRAQAESGAIKVELADHGGYTIDAQSRSGKVSGPAGSSPGARSDAHQFQQLLAGGGPLVDLDTRSSKIEID